MFSAERRKISRHSSTILDVPSKAEKAQLAFHETLVAYYLSYMDGELAMRTFDRT